MAIHPQIKILAIGRLLSAIGSGFTAFYAPIFFVNVVHLLPSAVGAGLGAGSLAGVVGRVLSGNLLESRWFARKGTILLASVFQCIGSLVLATTNNFSTFVIGSVLMGFGVGLYWPATQTLIADITGTSGMQEAVALTLLADYVGLAFGVILGGLLISFGGDYRLLFVADGTSFIIFFVVVCVYITESLGKHEKRVSIFQGWSNAFRDAHLRTYVMFNVLFTAYISMVSTALPLFFTNFVHYKSGAGFPNLFICGFFAEYVIIMSILQVPTAQHLAPFRKTRILAGATVITCAAFLSVWLTGALHSSELVLGAAIISMVLFGTAAVLYGPASSALLVGFAPANVRGIYMAINSLCWSAGAAIGPPIGLAVLGQSAGAAHQLWLGAAASTVLAFCIIMYLELSLKPGEATSESSG